jgi:glycosyltransferase involved in cell wall biosynthesis
MHVIDSLAPGGAERMLVDIANCTAVNTFHVSVCVTRSGCHRVDELDPKIPLYSLNRSRRFDWVAMRQFSGLVHKQAVTVLHAHSRSTFSFLALLKLCGLIRCPIILHDHFGGIEVDSSIPVWFRWGGYRLIDYYVGVYAKLGNWATAAGLPENKVKVIENALDLSRIQKAPRANLRKVFDLPEKALIGLVVANLRSDKGIDLLLDALAQCSHRYSTKLLVIGRDLDDKKYAQACRTRQANLGLEESFRFLGERLDVPRLIQGADFAVMPSRSESGPLVLLEYMAAGLPFVSTKVGAIARRVAESGLPEFVEPGSAAALACGLDRLLSLSPAERRARGRQGQAIALQQFDIRQAMPRWEEVYHTVREQAGQ